MEGRADIGLLEVALSTVWAYTYPFVAKRKVTSVHDPHLKMERKGHVLNAHFENIAFLHDFLMKMVTRLNSSNSTLSKLAKRSMLFGTMEHDLENRLTEKTGVKLSLRINRFLECLLHLLKGLFVVRIAKKSRRKPKK